VAQARLVLEELQRNKVTHVVGLPDNTSARLFELLENEDSLRLIRVTREGEAFALAAGLWIGGAKPVVLVQNTGFFESGDGFRGTITRMRVPLLCLITYRGYEKMGRANAGDGGTVPDAVALSDASLDSAALITEPTLRAWGLAFDFLHTDEDVSRISEACRRAEERAFPFAVLITRDLI
jgi:sulfopyruvate decarboxylase TPP-binding subunit